MRGYFESILMSDSDEEENKAQIVNQIKNASITLVYWYARKIVSVSD